MHRSDYVSWAWLETYLKEKRESRRCSKRAFPYHSYLKHKRNEFTDTYIQRATVRNYDELVRTTVQKPAVREVKDIIDYNESLSDYIRNNPISKNSNRELTASTTAHILAEKYKDLYDKLEATSRVAHKRLRQSKIIGVSQSISPFQDYLAQKPKGKKPSCRHANKPKIEAKVNIETLGGSTKVYIGPENFPLSVYERSIVFAYSRVW